MTDPHRSSQFGSGGGAADAVPLRRGQVARRQRVLDAAADLAREGGYDAVQMRDVAGRAGVALGTVYRYFTSKDHLLAAAFTDWAGAVERRLNQRPAKGATAADMVADVLRRASRAVAREPRLTAAFLAALSSSDPSVAGCQREIQTVFARLIAPGMEGVEPARQAGVVRTLGQVWFTTLLGWVNGWPDMGTMADDLEETARLLLE